MRILDVSWRCGTGARPVQVESSDGPDERFVKTRKVDVQGWTEMRCRVADLHETKERILLMSG